MELNLVERRDDHFKPSVDSEVHIWQRINISYNASYFINIICIYSSL